jgi:hypothetical protein
MRRLIHIDQEHNDAIRTEVGERLRIILRLSPPSRVPSLIRQPLDRLIQQDDQTESEGSPSIVPMNNEGWPWRSPGRRRR